MFLVLGAILEGFHTPSVVTKPHNEELEEYL
jgi:hypothetical protein